MRVFSSFLVWGVAVLATCSLVVAQSTTGVASVASPESAGDAVSATAQGASVMGSGTSEPVALVAVPEPVFSWSGYFEAIGIMLLLLGCLWLILWIIRRYGKLNFLPAAGALPRDALRMEAQLPLGPRKGLVVVRFLNERLLLGVTEHHITLLAERLLPEQPSTDELSGEALDESRQPVCETVSESVSEHQPAQPVTHQQFAEVLRARLFKKTNA